MSLPAIFFYLLHTATVPECQPFIDDAEVGANAGSISFLPDLKHIVRGASIRFFPSVPLGGKVHPPPTDLLLQYLGQQHTIGIHKESRLIEGPHRGKGPSFSILNQAIFLDKNARSQSAGETLLPAP
jgi:hypothetical protein